MEQAPSSWDAEQRWEFCSVSDAASAAEDEAKSQVDEEPISLESIAIPCEASNCDANSSTVSTAMRLISLAIRGFRNKLIGLMDGVDRPTVSQIAQGVTKAAISPAMALSSWIGIGSVRAWMVPEGPARHPKLNGGLISVRFSPPSSGILRRSVCRLRHTSGSDPPRVWRTRHRRRRRSRRRVGKSA